VDRFLKRVAGGLALVLACAAALAQTGEVDPSSIMAKDLHEEVVRIDVTLKDLYGHEETRRMPITIFRPDGDGPFPFVVFNHGRPPTDKRATQPRSRAEAFARYLVAKGFVVLAPTRIGYWETYGAFDPEDAGGCSKMRPDTMARVASDEVLATAAYAKSLPYVDTQRWIVAGVSVGGVAAIATAGRRPDGLIGGLNFSGGAGGSPVSRPGRSCRPDRIGELYAGAAAQTTVPMEWFYWSNDQFWGVDVPKTWFGLWTRAGGNGEFFAMQAHGADGHTGFNSDMDHWIPIVDRFLASLGFTVSATVERPAATGYAKVDEIDKLPFRGAKARAFYEKFLAAKSPRAFAIGDDGAVGYAVDDYVLAKALGFCTRSGQHCRLYAVDDEVVW
jgi:dienelactone hydrolase